MREAVELASRGGVLATDALARIAATVRGGLALRGALDEAVDLAPLLRERAAAVDPTLASLADSLERCVEEDGSDLRDTASPLLRRLRRELREGRHRVAEELRRLARDPSLREHLQEEFVAERGGRPVLAVKASARRSVPGIVHDSSGSGQTLFVEPFAVVELSNRQSEAAGAEREEATRILRELSDAVGARAEALAALVEAAAEIDLALACGTLSRGWRGAPVEVSDEVRLLAARHPLLDPAAAVPIDLDLADLRALVVSGPNTGGKTVALKTLGLAALLHQAGLRPPAEVAALPVFDRVLADIGDPQSIEMSLSTFSGHLRNLIAILDDASPRSLVLVDELASGTDPVEGSALAQALLERLATQARLTVVTTHYPELKEWASATDGAANAATALDPATHEPLYRVALGRPGVSHALETADRLGLDAGVVAAARARGLARAAADRGAPRRVGGGRARGGGGAGGGRGGAARSRGARGPGRRPRGGAPRRGGGGPRLGAAGARAGARRGRARPRRRAGRARGAPRGDPRRPAPRPGGAPERARGRARARPAARRRLAARGAGAAGAPRPRRAARGARAARGRRPRRGAGARDPGHDRRDRRGRGRGRGHGRAARPDRRSPGSAPTPGAAPAAEEPPAVRVLAAARGDVSDELDVRGRSSQEAREAVRAFVDDAALAGLASVRVVHGRGTGALRSAVRDELDRHPLVDGRESDSADGATVVTLGR